MPPSTVAAVLAAVMTVLMCNCLLVIPTNAQQDATSFPDTTADLPTTTEFSTTTSTTTTTTTTEVPYVASPKVRTVDGNLVFDAPRGEMVFVEGPDATTTTFQTLRADISMDAEALRADASEAHEWLASQLSTEADTRDELSATISSQLSSSITRQDMNLNNAASMLNAALDDAEESLMLQILSNEQSLNSRIMGAQNSLQANIAGVSSASASATASLATALSGEATQRSNADSQLGSRIDDVEDVIVSTTQMLEGSIDDASDSLETIIAADKTLLSNAIRTTSSTLGNTITNTANSLAASVAGVSSNVVARANALQGGVNSVAAALNGEAQNRVAKDNSLESRFHASTTVALQRSSTNSDDIDDLETALAAANAQINSLRSVACGSLTYSTRQNPNGQCDPIYPNGRRENMPDIRSSSTGWQTISYRDFKFTKQGSAGDTYLKVTIMDSFGFHSYYYHSHAMTFRLLVDGRCDQERCYKYWHSDAYYGWNIYSDALQWWFTDLGPGSHQFVLQWARTGAATSMLEGWSNGSQENHFAIDEVPASTVGIRSNFPDSRSGATSYTDIPEREVVFTKKFDDTDLHFSYSDVLGYYQQAHSSSMGMRAYLYGPNYPSGVFLGENWSHSHAGGRWRIYPRSMAWYARRGDLNLVKGTYRFKIQWRRSSGCSELLAGWPGNIANHLTAEEKHPSLIAVAPSRLNSGNTRYHFNDYRSTSGNWDSVPGRVVTHRKRSSSSLIRVTIMDTFGFYVTSSTTACLWRLLIDGSQRDTRWMWTHGSTVGGWRIDPRFYVFYVSVGTGSHTYVLQTNREGGSNHCLNGWSASNNFMLVEEIMQG